MARWRIRVKATGLWFNESTLATGFEITICEYPTRKAAKKDLKTSVLKCFWDDYEIVKVKDDDDTTGTTTH